MFKPLVLAAALLASVPAFAASTASIRFIGRDAGDPVIATSAGTNYATGALTFTDAASGSFLAYCIEPEQAFALSLNSKGLPNFKTYTVDSFTGSQALQLQALYSSSFASVHAGVQQAAFQLAVWEIVRETSGTLNVTKSSAANSTDSFYLTSTNSAVEHLANGYLSAAQNYNGSALYSLTKLTNATYQDLVVAQRITAAVPEPETYALFMGGLGVIGLLARRRLPR